MCVILMVDSNANRPSETMIEKAWGTNNDGAGIAWRPNKTEVEWRKGLDLKEIKDLCAHVPTPYIAHFRIASVGGTREELTHPFPVDKSAPLDMKGRIKGHVVFHNGHWADWQVWALKAAIESGISVPAGAWSDTRAIAWLCSIYGIGIIDFIKDSRLVAFGPSSIGIAGKDWKQINGVWCSNDFFMNRGTTFYGRGNTDWRPTMCRDRTCVETENLDTKGFCPKHRTPTAQQFPPALPPAPAEARGTQNVVPFLKQGELVTLAIAEQLQKKKVISRSLFKKIRKCHMKITSSKDPKDIQRAKSDLAFHSKIVAGAIVAGQLA